MLMITTLLTAILFTFSMTPGDVHHDTRLLVAAFITADNLTEPDCNNFHSTDINRLNEPKWQHIEAPHHQWREYGYATRAQITSAFRNAFSTGSKRRYGGKGTACQANVVERSPDGSFAFVTVTYQIIGGTARVGSAWVTALNCAFPCSGGP